MARSGGAARVRRRIGAGLVAAAVLASACSGASDTDERPTVRVFAAASLGDAFTGLAGVVEALEPSLRVEIVTAGSSALREQILDGAPADVVATAGTQVMDDLAAAGVLAGAPVEFAGNELRLAVPAGNPAGLAGLDDLARDELLVGLCAAEVPCGAFGRALLDRAGIEPRPDTEEPDVRSLLAKVAAGELDVGLVYATDVVAAGGDVAAIVPDGADEVPVRYPIAVLADAAYPEAAERFVAVVTSDAGADVLRQFGFHP